MILTVDPGFGGIGWALWRVPARPIGADLLRAHLRDWGCIGRDDTKDDLPSRIGWRVEVFADLLRLHEVATVVIETPQIARPYGARTTRGAQLGSIADMQMHLRLAGALEGAAHLADCEVWHVRPGTKKKQGRLATLRLVLPDVLSGRTNKHVRDALHLGLVVLTDHRRWGGVAA